MLFIAVSDLMSFPSRSEMNENERIQVQGRKRKDSNPPTNNQPAAKRQNPNQSAANLQTLNQPAVNLQTLNQPAVNLQTPNRAAANLQTPNQPAPNPPAANLAEFFSHFISEFF